jgi:uncharacterized protein with HEPN domain
MFSIFFLQAAHKNVAYQNFENLREKIKYKYFSEKEGIVWVEETSINCDLFVNFEYITSMFCCRH